MSNISDSFPEQRLVWPGAVLASIAHAVMVARYPDLSHEQSWDGANYNVQDSAGSRGAIGFAGPKFVAVVFYENSDRNPFSADVSYDLDNFFSGLPADLQGLARDGALQYMLQDLDGVVTPIITSAFWGDAQSMYVGAAEPWSDVFSHGAALFRRQLSAPELAIQNWIDDYGLKVPDVRLVRLLFDRKMNNPKGSIELNEAEATVIRSIAKGTEGLEASRESFREIGIVF